MNISKRFVLWLILFSSASLVKAADGLEIKDAWIPEAPPVAKVMAGYMQVTNPGAKDIIIESASSGAFNSIEMHETVHDKGVSKMIRQKTVTVPAGKSKHFQRGGLHLMLFKPKKPLKLNDVVDITLTTSQGVITIQAQVKQASLEDDHSHHHH